MGKFIIDAHNDIPWIQEVKKDEAQFIANLLNVTVTVITSNGEIHYQGGKDNGNTQADKRPLVDGIR